MRSNTQPPTHTHIIGEGEEGKEDLPQDFILVFYDQIILAVDLITKYNQFHTL